MLAAESTWIELFKKTGYKYNGETASSQAFSIFSFQWLALIKRRAARLARLLFSHCRCRSCE
jgi:hypothetical protein